MCRQTAKLFFHIVASLTWTFKMKTLRSPINFKTHFLFKSFLLNVLIVFNTHCCSTKKNFLHPVCSNAGFIFWVRLTLGCGAVRGRAAGGGAFWRTQIVHEGEAILPTEVHKLNLSDTTVKIDSTALWVWTIAGWTQVSKKIPRKIIGSVRNTSDLNGSCS